VFGDRDSGAYLQKFAWTRIVRHPVVKGTASTDDPTLTDYWASRRRNGTRRGPDSTKLRLLQQQHGRCPRCGELLLHADHPPQTPSEWEQWLAATRKAITKHSLAQRAGGAPDDSNLRLTHARCHRRKPAPGQRPGTSARQPAPGACLSRMHGNVHVRF
jgi:RNA-directed DNA polymerase